jgi:transposase
MFVAEVGDVRRCARAEELTCRAGLRPEHRESDKHVHRGRITTPTRGVVAASD